MDIVQDRILPRVVVDENGCWNWQGPKNSKGYGVVMVNRRRTTPYRLAYEAENGPVPEGLEMDHLCRNRACCNPKHLEAVTHAENNRRAGPYHSRFKVTPEMAHEIRAAYEAGEGTQRELGRRFGVSRTMVNFVVNGKRRFAA